MILEIQLNGQQLHVYTTPETELVLGRGREADLLIDSDEVSRVHCVIKESNGKYYVKDLKSANGTFVYDEKIHPETFCEFLTEFPVRLGKTILIFIRESEPVADLEEFGDRKKKRADPNAQTRIFTGVVKKDLLKTKKVESKSQLILILPLLVIGLGAAFYFWQGYQANQEAQTIVPTVVEAPPAPEVKLPFPASGCFYDDEKTLCQSLELPQDDYVAFIDGELALVTNIARMLDNKMTELAPLPEEEKKRALMLHLLNRMHANSLNMVFSPELNRIVVYGASADYKQLNSKMTLQAHGLPPAEEMQVALDAAITAGSLTEFETKYGQFYKLE